MFSSDYFKLEANVGRGYREATDLLYGELVRENEFWL